jgi:hypothetical protein
MELSAVLAGCIHSEFISELGAIADSKTSGLVKRCES